MTTERRAILRLLTLGGIALAADGLTRAWEQLEKSDLPEYLRDEHLYLRYLRELLDPRETIGCALSDTGWDNPSFAPEVSNIPQLTSPIGEGVTIPIVWTTPKKLERLRQYFPEFIDFVGQQKPHLPRVSPILRLTSGAVIEVPEVPRLPGMVTLDPQLLKGQVLILKTCELLERGDLVDIRWLLLTNRLTAPLLNPTQSPRYPAQISIRPWEHREDDSVGNPQPVDLNPPSTSGHLFFMQDFRLVSSLRDPRRSLDWPSL